LNNAEELRPGDVIAYRNGLAVIVQTPIRRADDLGFTAVANLVSGDVWTGRLPDGPVVAHRHEQDDEANEDYATTATEAPQGLQAHDRPTDHGDTIRSLVETVQRLRGDIDHMGRRLATIENGHPAPQTAREA
jgi:hypothetical protein